MLILAHRDCPRLAAVQAALVHLGRAPAIVLSWCDYLAGRPHHLLSAHSRVRLESPGRDAIVEQQLIDRGGGLALADPPERGQWWQPAAWHRGWQATLAELAEYSHIDWMNHPTEIITLYQKAACHKRLAAMGVPVPPALPPVHDVESLLTAMHQPGWSRVFIKLEGGSSAAGMIALQIGRNRWRAETTLEMVKDGIGPRRFYSNRRIHVYESIAEIRTLLERIIAEGVHIEQWVPKAGFRGHCFDLRIITIGGEPYHTLARLSRGPFTNLHLLNQRLPIAELLPHLPPEAWPNVLHTARQVAATFPRCHTLGIDVAWTPNYQRHVVLEVNAFGEYLPGTLWNGEDTYTLALRTWSPPDA